MLRKIFIAAAAFAIMILFSQTAYSRYFASAAIPGSSEYKSLNSQPAIAVITKTKVKHTSNYNIYIYRNSKSEPIRDFRYRFAVNNTNTNATSTISTSSMISNTLSSDKPVKKNYIIRDFRYYETDLNAAANLR